MPTVQRYGARKVSTAALPGVRKSAAETDISTGAGLAQAQGQAGVQTGEALGRLGETAANVGLQLGANELRQREEARKKHDALIDMTSQNQLDTAAATLVRDPKTGALLTKGPATLGLTQSVLEKLDQQAGTIAQTLTSDEQRLRFENHRQRVRLQTQITLDNHAQGEMQRWGGQELTAFVANKRDEVIAVAPSLGDPASLHATRIQIHDALTAAVTQIQTVGPTLGMGPEGIKEAIDKTTTSIHSGVIESLLAQDRTKSAQVYFEEAVAANQIHGEARTKLQDALDTATTATKGLTAADAIWSQHGPKGESDPINLDTMETAARAQFADDPKALRATIQQLRERKAGVDAGRQDRKEQTAGSLWAAVAQGATLADIRRMPEYLKAPGQLQTQISEHIVTEAQQKADRSYTLSQRGEAEKSRLEKQKEDAGWAMLWHYDTPEILAKMTDNQVLALTPDLGIAHVNRLMTKKRALVKGDDTVRAATIDEDLFKSTAQSAGLNPYGAKLSDSEKSALGQLRNTVETAIDQEQQRTGKPLTRDAKQAIMHGIVDRKVMVDRWGAGEAIASTVVNPKDRAAAYVPLDKIPDQNLTEAVNLIRGFRAYAQTLSREQVLAIYKHQIQRAFAAKLLKLGDAEETARLKEKY